LAHQGAGGQEHEIHMPGLALAIPELTITHTQMLLPVPIKGLRDSPALAIGLQDAMDLPVGAIGNQDFDWVCIALLARQHHNPHGMVDSWDADTLGEVPVDFAIRSRFPSAEWPSCAFTQSIAFQSLPSTVIVRLNFKSPT